MTDIVERLRKERDEFTEMDYTAELKKRDDEINQLRERLVKARNIMRRIVDTEAAGSFAAAIEYVSQPDW